MPDLQLVPDLYVTPSPGGAYYACSSMEADITRRVLFRLMSQKASPKLDLETVPQLTGMEYSPALELLYRMQSLYLLQGFSEQQYATDGPLEQVLPVLLDELAGEGKALLSDGQGFYVASHGYPHETAEELSALSADLGLLHQRHRHLLNHNMALRTGAWGVIGAGGTSEVGFWPLYIGQQRFVLVLSGVPRMNQPALLHLAWALNIRYAEEDS